MIPGRREKGFSKALPCLVTLYWEGGCVSQTTSFALDFHIYIGRHDGISPGGLESHIQHHQESKSPIHELGGKEDIPIALISSGNDLVNLFTCRYFRVCPMRSRTLTAHYWIPTCYSRAQDMAGDQ